MSGRRHHQVIVIVIIINIITRNAHFLLLATATNLSGVTTTSVSGNSTPKSQYWNPDNEP
jgi:hypothetical protein